MFQIIKQGLEFHLKLLPDNVDKLLKRFRTIQKSKVRTQLEQSRLYNVECLSSDMWGEVVVFRARIPCADSRLAR